MKGFLHRGCRTGQKHRSQKEFTMNIRTLLVACASVLAATVAEAGVIFSPAIFGSHAQNQATCVALNVGTTSMSVTVKILNESGGIENSGTAVLAPGQFFAVHLGISFGVAYACSAQAPDVSKLRAALTIIDIVPDGDGSVNHRPIRSSPLR
jgi:hypothetical protein